MDQGYYDSEYLLSRSLVSTELLITTPLQNGPHDCTDQYKTDEDLIDDVLLLVTKTEQLVVDPLRKSILHQCHKLLSNSGAQRNPLEEEFVIITKEQIDEATTTDVRLKELR